MLKSIIAVIALIGALVAPALANTSAPVWSDEDNLRLDDSALGTWCVANKHVYAPLDSKKTRVYERNQNCFQGDVWIVIGPRSYRTSDRQCTMIGTARAEYHKNLLVQYRCTSNENGKTWIERAEFGFFSDDHLYVIRN